MKDYGNLVFEEVASDQPVGRVKCALAVGSANRRLSEAVQEVKKDGHTSVMLGGDHRWVPEETGEETWTETPSLKGKTEVK